MDAAIVSTSAAATLSNLHLQKKSNQTGISQESHAGGKIFV